MSKEKRISWLSIITGALFLCAGIRNIVAPGFLCISGHLPDSGESAAYIIVGLLFLSVPASVIEKKKSKNQ